MLNDVTLTSLNVAEKPRSATLAQNGMEGSVDRSLIEACMREERRAQQRLYELTYSRLMNVCLRYTKDEEEARSHFVQGFLKILNNLSRYSYEGVFEAWASRVMINSVLDDLRRNKKYKQTHIHTENENIEHKNDVDWNAFEQKANAEYVMSLVKKLPDASRQVFLLFGIDGYSHKEIGTMLGITEGTSKWHLFEARKKLIHMLSAQYNYTVHGKR